MSGRGILFFCMIVLSSCGTGSDTSEKTLLASVYDKELYLQDIEQLFPSDLLPEDSIQFLRTYVDKWIRETVILEKAENALPEEVKNVEARLEEYRRSLLIYEYEKEFASQKLDTNVQEEELIKHYKDHQEDFKLADYILKVLYVKVEKNDRGRDKINRWFRSVQPKDLQDLEKYCVDNAVNYYKDSGSWIFLNDLLKEVPLKVSDKGDFLRNNKHITFEDEDFAYYLTIYEYQLKDGVSPFSLERENIKARILNTRTTELIRKMRLDLLKEASGQIKNYAEN
jgi:hypothetical protein